MTLRRSRGLTLIEIVVALAVLAVLGTIALPGFGARLDRERLHGAAQALAADLNEARFEAARQGRALHLVAVDGPAWCWAVATTPDCPCGGGQGCQLRSAREQDHPGVALRTPGHVELRADGRAGTPAVAFELESARGLRLRVSLGAMGRAQVCTLSSPAADALRRHPLCAGGL
ncbi:MAG: GspH/FimT family pseudopilin [Betaproteobacteria bacterium]|jgi:type IV fimbrial biogenesis protein FimT